MTKDFQENKNLPFTTSRVTTSRVHIAKTVVVWAALSLLPIASSASAAPSLPLPAPQKATQKATSQATPTSSPDDNDEPFIAPSNVDIPLHRGAPNGTAGAKLPSAAGPLPQTAPIPTRRDNDLARDHSPNAKDATAKGATAKGASVGGVSIEKLSDRAAVLKLRRVLDAKLRAPVALSDGQKSWLLRRDELGATAPLGSLVREARYFKRDVPLRFNLNLKIAARALRVLAAKTDRVTSNRTDGVIPVNMTVARGPQKITLSVAGSVSRLRQALEAQPPRLSVDLDVDVAPVKAGESSTGMDSDKPWLKKTPFLLAEFSTHYDSSIAGRTTNLKLAAKNVDGTVVNAGKIFSTNLAIGRRDAANGWKEAKMFMDGQVVNGIGSGICQCASTIYNAALLAGLPIVERHPHTFRVSYAPASRDATIYWGSKDFRFRNDTPGPIYVRTFLKNDRFHVELYGVAPVTNEIEVSSRVLSRKSGTRSEAFRVIKTAGGAKTEKLSSDFYRPHP